MENIDGSLRLLLLLKLEDENSSANPGWLTVSSPLLCSFNDSIRPFKINKSQVNWSAVKSWLEECEQKHTNACNHDSTSHSPAGLRVIDCETRKIISAPEVCKYTALSYVWSQNKENDVAEKHSLFKPPRAIEAAITCTTIIGFRYLWIDRYCIDHEDIATKHTLIQGMDEVYRGAAVTLIFATGQGVESGVPGISYILRPQQLTTSVNGLDITLMPDTQGSVARSKWASRGW